MTDKPNQPLSTKGQTAAEISLAEEHAETKRLTNLIGICLLPVAACIGLGVYYLLVGRRGLANGGQHLADLGNFGSYLQGTTGSFWALAGVFIIFLAFLIQARQLFEQREQFRVQQEQQKAEIEDQKKHFEAERADQQKQIDAQRQQFESQQESIKRQNFESSFFQLVNLQNQITAGLRFQPHSNIPPYRGKDCFKPLCDVLKGSYLERTSFLPENELGHIRAAYLEFHSSAQVMTASYFRNLYHIIKFIQTSEVKDKRRYTSLVRAQLSAYEILLLFYNALSPVGDGFKARIEECGLLKHLEDSLLMERSHRQLYAQSAYQ